MIIAMQRRMRKICLLWMGRQVQIWSLAMALPLAVKFCCQGNVRLGPIRMFGQFLLQRTDQNTSLVKLWVTHLTFSYPQSLILLEGNLLKPGNPHCGPTNQWPMTSRRATKIQPQYNCTCVNAPLTICLKCGKPHPPLAADQSVALVRRCWPKLLIGNTDNCWLLLFL